MGLSLEIPVSTTSFGQISYSMLEYAYKRNLTFNLAFVSGVGDFRWFDKADERFFSYVSARHNCYQSRLSNDDVFFKLWHIRGAEYCLPHSKKFLLTFHELDCITETEANILNLYDGIFVTSSFTKDVFLDGGVQKPVHVVRFGIDRTHFYKLDRRKSNDKIIIAVFGKAEKRKHTIPTCRYLVKRFGGNREFEIRLHIHNHFLNQQEMDSIYAAIFEGKPVPFNVTIVGPLPNNTAMNQAYNDCDIVVDMSGGEGISMPSLICVALGKHAVVHYCTGIKEWATAENTVLVYPNGKTPAADGKFFAPTGDFSIGNIHTWSLEDFDWAINEVLSRYRLNSVNVKGLELAEKFDNAVGAAAIFDVLLREGAVKQQA